MPAAPFGPASVPASGERRGSPPPSASGLGRSPWLRWATTSTAFFDRHAPHLVDLRISGFLLTLAATTLGGFAFLMIVYRYLTNVPLHRGDVMPGAVVGAVLFQVSLQALPLYLRFSGQLLALRAFGGLVILLVWLYLMANIIVLGAEINSVRWHQRREAEVEPPGLA